MVSAALAIASLSAPLDHAPGWACAGPGAPAAAVLAPLSVQQSIVQQSIVQQNRPRKPKMTILIFSKTGGFRHDSIETGVKAIMQEADKLGWAVDWTEDSTQFTEEKLNKYKAVVFLNTTGDILNEDQQKAFESYIHKGRGYVGIHAAADTEYSWLWYGQLVGAYFMSHPHIQKATIKVLDHSSPSTRHLGPTWIRTDEWYDYKSQPIDGATILMKLDTTTYEGHKMGAEHPTCWCHEFEGGRAWYTGGGHTKESFSEPDFMAHVIGGIKWAAKAK